MAGNKNVEWLPYADEGHGFRMDADRIDYWKHVEKFLDKYLRNAGATVAAR